MKKAGSVKQCILFIDLEGQSWNQSVRAERVQSNIMF